MLGTTTALLGSVVASLLAFGVLLEGRWLWVGSPRGTSVIAVAAWLVALVITVSPVAAVGLGALFAAPVSWTAVGTVVVVVTVAADAAVVAGVLVPWGDGAGDQLTTFAAFGAVAIATSLAVGVSSGSAHPTLSWLSPSAVRPAAVRCRRSGVGSREPDRDRRG
jgi:hypothetical protein